MKTLHASMTFFLCMALMFPTMACIASAQDFADSVRELNAAQNRMAIGRESAKEQVASRLKAIEALIPALEPEAWTQSRNIRAAVIYLLGGGASEHLREIFDAGFIAESEAPLLEAALLSVEGDKRGADRIATFDPTQFTALLGGHLALVQGGALVGHDNSRAIAKLDLARLLMPTSLVEEAALRREIRALDASKDREKILALASIYAIRYRASPYARHMISDLRTLLSRSEIGGDDEFAAKLEQVLEIAPVSERLEIYLARCRAALLAGRFDEARRRLAKAFSVAETREMRERLSAYQDLFVRIEAPGQQATGVKEPTGLASLTPDDRRIVSIVASVLSRLDTPPPPSRSGEDKTASRDEHELVERARIRLEHVDMILNGNKPR